MRRILCILLLALTGLFLAAGCGGKDAPQKPKAFYEVTDSAGSLVCLEKKPERIVLLGTAFPDMLTAVGGDFIACATSPGNESPAWAKGKTTVGYTYQVNAEAVIGLSPDLVIGLHGLHDRLALIMKENGIPFLSLALSRYEDVERAAEILADVSGQHEKGVKEIQKLREEMQREEARAADEGLTCAILHGTAQAVTIEGADTIAGETAQRLHIRNVFADEVRHGMKLPPFSLEALAEKDPDMIFLTTMMMPGAQEDAFRASLLKQPAWAGLSAVKNGRVYFLPQSLFLASPGLRYPEALRTMADCIRKEES